MRSQTPASIGHGENYGPFPNARDRFLLALLKTGSARRIFLPTSTSSRASASSRMAVSRLSRTAVSRASMWSFGRK